MVSTRAHSVASEPAGSSLTAASISSPFGLTSDPATLVDTVYTSPQTLISQTIYSLSETIFSYSAPGADSLLDAAPQLWKTYQRPNIFGTVPSIQRFDTRSGASNVFLGYLNGNPKKGIKTPISVLIPGNTLTYMQPALSENKESLSNLPVSFQISTIDYDDQTNSLVSNHLTPLSVARNLQIPVISPLTSNGPEVQHISLITSLLSTKSPVINLFDGPNYVKNFSKVSGVLSPSKIKSLADELAPVFAAFDSSSVTKRIQSAFVAFNNAVGTNYKLFQYVGHESPETVFVIYGSSESEIFTNKINELYSKYGTKVGVVAIRVPLPFSVEDFSASIPTSTTKIVVVGQVSDSLSTSSSLKADVNTALFLSNRLGGLKVSEFTYPLNFVWSSIIIHKILSSFHISIPSSLSATKFGSEFEGKQLTANTSPRGDFIFWGSDNSSLINVSSKLAHALSLDDSVSVKYRSKFDNINGAGILQSQIITKSFPEFSKIGNIEIDSADIVLVDGISVLNHFDVVSTTKPQSTILLVFENEIQDLQKDVIEKLPESFKRAAAINKNKVIVVDTGAIGEDETTQGFTALFVVQTAWWRSALPELGEHVVHKLLQSVGSEFELLPSVVSKLVAKIDQKAIKEVQISVETLQPTEKESTEEEVVLPFFPIESSFAPNPRNSDVSGEITSSTYVEAAKRITFKESYGLSNELRPDLPVKNFVVKVQENKRLTPSDYSRNIFHIEFDITGTGLTYDIGEALGVHGRNDEKFVDEFIAFYGLVGENVSQTPNKEDSSLIEIRTVRQVLTENLDFLGKPPKKFYENLAEYATDVKEKATLTFIGSAEGKEELKRRQEVEYSSYFDILEEFKSARPSFEKLVQLIAPLKRREYSIASSQKLHPNAVHLLVVVNDWMDNQGRKRYGHCSTYMSKLNIGDELIVSVKPSVMKLPPLSTQPIVMSGLGTGLAPFKAFVEEKVWQKQQGMEIGEVYLYLGSRHRKEEYLYGELWEAYKDAGIVTHVGAAFSRDQPAKIYIQDRIRENIDELTDAIVAKNGSFYLCGPTWPVPDITACLEDVVSKGALLEGKTVDAAKEVEEMKETGRYILEVY